MDNISWMGKAACRGSGANMYPDSGRGKSNKALEVCSGCAVKGECLNYSLDNMHRPGRDELGRPTEGLFIGPGAFGVWGGVSEGARRAMSKARDKSHLGPQFQESTVTEPTKEDPDAVKVTGAIIK